MMGHCRLAAVLLLFLCGPLAPAGAAEIRHVTEYDISLGVLSIARASFESRFDGRSYTIAGSFRSAGIANILTRISARSEVRGRLTGERLQADSYNLVYTSGRRTRVYDVAYRNGNVTKTTIAPEPRRDPQKWVAVPPADLRAVLDPISGMIFPAGARACPARLPIYDGESRMDLVLSPKGTKPFSTRGFKGEAVVCTVRYVPKSGFRRGRSDIEHLRKVTMEVWFAKADAANVMAPVYARIPTAMGSLYVKAARFGG